MIIITWTKHVTPNKGQGSLRGHELMGRALASIDGIYDEHGVGKRNTCGAVGAHSRILLEEVSFNR